MRKLYSEYEFTAVKPLKREEETISKTDFGFLMMMIIAGTTIFLNLAMTYVNYM